RLQAAWDDISGTSEMLPLTSQVYQDATSTVPGRVDSAALIDAVSGTARHTVTLFSADGEAMVSGTWLGDHFALGQAGIEFRNTRTRRGSFAGTMTGDALSALTSDGLRALGTTLVETQRAGFGHATQTTATQQDSVVGVVTSELVLTTGELITRTHQP